MVVYFFLAGGGTTGALVWGMPGNVVASNLADHIYPLGGIAPQVVRRVSMQRASAGAGGP